jgi:hypothetical protein
MKWILVVFSISAMDGGSGFRVDGEYDDARSCQDKMSEAAARRKIELLGNFAWSDCVDEGRWQKFSGDLHKRFNHRP